MENEILPKLAESGATMLLLGYVVWSLVSFLRCLTDAQIALLKGMADNLQAMTARVVESNGAMAQALKDAEAARTEAATSHQEQLLILKMLTQRLVEKDDG